MPGIITGISDIPVNLQGYYDRNLLERATPALIFSRFGQIRPIPKNQGTRINFRRYGSLPVNTTELGEGVTPTGKKLSATTIYANLSQYGDFVTITDWIEMTGLDPILMEAGEILGEQAGQTIDILTRNVLMAGTSVRYGSGVANRAAVTNELKDADIDSVIRTLEGNNTKKIREQINAGAKISTSPIRPSYIAISHTDSRYDIENLTGFKSVEEYASQGDVMPEEIGSVKNIRFLLTTHGKIWESAGAAVGATGLKAVDATNIDVYGTIILAKNAYGEVPLQKKTIKNIVKKMGSAGTEDPLDQRSTSGWKAAHVAKILNDDFMVRIEHGVTDL